MTTNEGFELYDLRVEVVGPPDQAIYCGARLGDYFELAVGPDGRNQVIWGEGTSYSGPGGCWFTRGQ